VNEFGDQIHGDLQDYLSCGNVKEAQKIFRNGIPYTHLAVLKPLRAFRSDDGFWYVSCIDMVQNGPVTSERLATLLSEHRDERYRAFIVSSDRL
jgi:hypothetical protein